jgi:hypothetical protein
MGNTLIKYGTSHTATKILTTEADEVAGEFEVYATLTHEWGAEIVEQTRATQDSALNYSIDYTDLQLRVNGVYKLKWEYTIDSVVYTDYDTITVYTPYAIESTFFEKYPYLDNAENDYQFDVMEQKVRNLIHSYCGQKFEYYPGQILSVDGTGNRELLLPSKINAITEVIASYGDSLGTSYSDETENVEKSPDSDWYIRWKGSTVVFKPSATYAIDGDWGWIYVPDNVTQAAELLLAEQFNDDNTYRNHAVTDIYMDTHRMRIDDNVVWNSTGFVDADVLLMDYIKWEVSWV